MFYESYKDYRRGRVVYTNSLKFTAQERHLDRLGNVNIKSIQPEHFYDAGIVTSVIEKTLLQKEVLKDTSDLLGNHFIRLYNLNDYWALLESSNQFQILGLESVKLSQTDKEKLSKPELSALRAISSHIKSNNLAVSYDTLSRQALINVNSSDPEMTMKLMFGFYQNLREDYLQNKDELNDLALEVLEKREKEVLDALNKTSKRMEEVSKMLQNEKADYLPNIFKMDNLSVDPDEFLSKESMLYFNIESEKYESIQALYDDVIDKIDQFKFQIENRRIDFQVLDSQIVPMMQQPNYVSSLISNFMNWGFIKRLFSILAILYLIALVIYTFIKFMPKS